MAAESQTPQVDQVQRSPVNFDAKLSLISEQWSPRVVAEMNCSTRLGAAKELNVMFGVTFTDADGKTHATRHTLEDFQRLSPKSKMVGEVTTVEAITKAATIETITDATAAMQ
ncbi:hypothetical protein [Paraburkholderia sp. BL10I2N1]|uniref:hypothetical protein n=1 Tax=Paraburkholderia sp. BL10I2N1 TaxID=1938796 RepID=UPI00105B246C|nr:hypothetical protein [Paraburkholderia sp. BL10I2N1]TDN61524.1 hypothetical protein B0G77_4990 [Paraburkholderia sp. BL10I2N1]